MGLFFCTIPHDFSSDFLSNVTKYSMCKKSIWHCNVTSTIYVLLPLITTYIDSRTFPFLPITNTQLRFLHENIREQCQLDKNNSLQTATQFSLYKIIFEIIKGNKVDIEVFSIVSDKKISLNTLNPLNNISIQMVWTFFIVKKLAFSVLYAIFTHVVSK